MDLCARGRRHRGTACGKGERGRQLPRRRGVRPPPRGARDQGAPSVDASRKRECSYGPHRGQHKAHSRKTSLVRRLGTAARRHQSTASHDVAPGTCARARTYMAHMRARHALRRGGRHARATDDWAPKQLKKPSQ